jgi:hypothetical protein
MQNNSGIKNTLITIKKIILSSFHILLERVTDFLSHRRMIEQNLLWIGK